MRWFLAVLMLPTIAFATPTPDTAIKGKLADADWQYVAQKISAGDQIWIDTVPALASKANRAQAEQLEDALATALPINTKGVLSILKILDAGSYPEMNGTNIVCVLKLAAPGKPPEGYYNDTRLALLDEPNGAQCLWNLEGIWEEVKQKDKQNTSDVVPSRMHIQ